MFRLTFKQKLWITLAIIGGGALISLLIGGLSLALIFLLLAFDKTVLGMAGILRRVGIEFTTILTIFLGILHGPVFAFFFTIITVPLFHAIKFFFLPMQPDWPLFVPAPYNVVDAIGASLAALLKGLVVGQIMLAVITAKIILYAVVDRFAYGRPPDLLGAVTYFAFNMVAVTPFAHLLVVWTGVPVRF